MKVAFLLGYDPKRHEAYTKSPHLGVMRPFMNWAKALGERSMLVFYKCSDVFRGTEDKALLESTIISTDDTDELGRILRGEDIDYLISDDYVPRAKFSLELTQTLDVKKCVYVQLLYGMHALTHGFSKNPLNLKSKLTFSTLPLIPFRLLSRKYCDLLRKFDNLVANSHFTASLLHYLYGLEVSDVVYPPVDEMVFRPHSKNGALNEVTLYCGSNAGDTNPTLLKQLLESLANQDSIHRINLLGNRAICHLSNAESRAKVNRVQSISDTKLADLYSRSVLTICPQEWETFGYVPVESMLCGTPVLAFASQPSCELVRGEDVALLTYSKRMFFQRLKELVTDMDRLQFMKRKCFQRREHLLNYVSKTHSVSKLLSILS